MWLKTAADEKGIYFFLFNRCRTGISSSCSYVSSSCGLSGSCSNQGLSASFLTLELPSVAMETGALVEVMLVVAAALLAVLIEQY